MIDERIVRAAQDGDEQAFAALLEQSYEHIYRLSVRWAGNISDAEDIAQQVCIKLARVLAQFKFESAFTTWLYRVVLNCARDWARAKRRHDSDTEYDDASETFASNNEQRAQEANSELERVMQVVEKMGSDYKEALLLVFAEGMSHAEAAQIMDVKESTVSWRIHEIRKQLKQRFPDEGART